MLRPIVLIASVRFINNNAQQILTDHVSAMGTLDFSIYIKYSLPVAYQSPADFHRGKPYHGSWQTRIKKRYQKTMAKNALGGLLRTREIYA